jgi:hypothetical protein
MSAKPDVNPSLTISAMAEQARALSDEAGESYLTK